MYRLIFQLPISIKNKGGRRNPKIHQAKKDNQGLQFYFCCNTKFGSVVDLLIPDTDLGENTRH